MTTSQISDINDLIGTWPDFYKRPDYYISVHIPELLANPQKCTMRESLLIDCIKDRKNLSALVRKVYEQNVDRKVRLEIESILKSFNFSKADEFYKLHEKSLPDYESIRNSAWQEYEQKVINQIANELERYHFESAERLFLSIQSTYPRTAYDQLLAEYRLRKEKEDQAKLQAEIAKQITQLLEKYDFDGADEKYKLVAEQYPQEQYQQLVLSYRRKQEREKLVADLQTAFRNNQFQSADLIYQKTDLLTEDEYVQLKSPWIKEYVQKHYGESINLEKAAALAHPGRNLLLSARAGSGKTTVLACKTSLLIDTETSPSRQNISDGIQYVRRRRNSQPDTAEVQAAGI